MSVEVREEEEVLHGDTDREGGGVARVQGQGGRGRIRYYMGAEGR